jgi:hypothetical protein
MPEAPDVPMKRKPAEDPPRAALRLPDAAGFMRARAAPGESIGLQAPLAASHAHPAQGFSPSVEEKDPSCKTPRLK